MENILVTGGAGYVGSHTVAALAEYGFNPIVYDNFCKGHRDFIKWGIGEEGDIRDYDNLVRVINKYSIKNILHFAAFSFVNESVISPAIYYDNNVVGTYKLLEAARNTGIKNFIFSSTCATYGIPQTVPITENTPQLPINPYGNTKLVIEKMLMDYKQAYGINYGIFRYFNAAGADPKTRIGERHNPETHLIPLILDAAIGKRPSITIFGEDYDTPDGTCIRDYIHVSDLATAHTELLRKMIASDESYVLNLGTGNGMSVLDVINAVKYITKKEFKVEHGTRRAGDPAALVASSEKAKNVLNWEPKYTDINTIVEHAWKWCLKENGQN